MAITIDNAFVRQYRDICIHLAQQKEQRLRNYVTEVSLRGEAYSFDRLAPTDAVLKSDLSPGGTVQRRLDTVYVDDTWSRRVVNPKTFTHTMTVEHEDKVAMLIQPENEYAKNQAYAMARAYDDLIIAAATGDAQDGDGNAVTFPAGQQVGDYTGEISFDMITEVQEKFLTNEYDMDVPKVMVIGPKQVRKLLQLEQQTSADYVRREALQKLANWGLVPSWMGFTWILSNRLEAPLADQLTCLAFTKDAIGLAVNQDVFVRIGENPSKSYMIQIFSQFTANATRVVDEGIVSVAVADTVTP